MFISRDSRDKIDAQSSQGGSSKLKNSQSAQPDPAPDELEVEDHNVPPLGKKFWRPPSEGISASGFQFLPGPGLKAAGTPRLPVSTGSLKRAICSPPAACNSLSTLGSSNSAELPQLQSDDTPPAQSGHCTLPSGKDGAFDPYSKALDDVECENQKSFATPSPRTVSKHQDVGPASEAQRNILRGLQSHSGIANAQPENFVEEARLHTPENSNGSIKQNEMHNLKAFKSCLSREQRIEIANRAMIPFAGARMPEWYKPPPGNDFEIHSELNLQTSRGLGEPNPRTEQPNTGMEVTAQPAQRAEANLTPAVEALDKENDQTMTERDTCDESTIAVEMSPPDSAEKVNSRSSISQECPSNRNQPQTSENIGKPCLSTRASKKKTSAREGHQRTPPGGSSRPAPSTQDDKHGSQSSSRDKLRRNAEPSCHKFMTHTTYKRRLPLSIREILENLDRYAKDELITFAVETERIANDINAELNHTNKKLSVAIEEKRSLEQQLAGLNVKFSEYSSAMAQNHGQLCSHLTALLGGQEKILCVVNNKVEQSTRLGEAQKELFHSLQQKHDQIQDQMEQGSQVAMETRDEIKVFREGFKQHSCHQDTTLSALHSFVQDLVRETAAAALSIDKIPDVVHSSCEKTLSVIKSLHDLLLTLDEWYKPSTLEPITECLTHLTQDFGHVAKSLNRSDSAKDIVQLATVQTKIASLTGAMQSAAQVVAKDASVQILSSKMEHLLNCVSNVHVAIVNDNDRIEEICKLKGELATVVERLRNTKSALEDMEIDCQTKHEEYQRAETERISLAKQMSITDASGDLLARLSVDIEERIKNLCDEREQSYQKLEVARVESVQALAHRDNEIENLKADVAGLTAQLTESRHQLESREASTQEKAKNELETRLQELRSRLEQDSRSEFANSEQRWRRQMEKVQSRLHAEQARGQAADMSIAEKDSQISRLNADLRRQSAESSQMNTSLVNLEEMARQLRAQMTTTFQTYEAAFREKCEETRAFERLLGLLNKKLQSFLQSLSQCRGLTFDSQQIIRVEIAKGKEINGLLESTENSDSSKALTDTLTKKLHVAVENQGKCSEMDRIFEDLIRDISCQMPSQSMRPCSPMEDVPFLSRDDQTQQSPQDDIPASRMGNGTHTKEKIHVEASPASPARVSFSDIQNSTSPIGDVPDLFPPPKLAHVEQSFRPRSVSNRLTFASFNEIGPGRQVHVEWQTQSSRQIRHLHTRSRAVPLWGAEVTQKTASETGLNRVSETQVESSQQGTTGLHTDSKQQQFQQSETGRTKKICPEGATNDPKSADETSSELSSLPASGNEQAAETQLSPSKMASGIKRKQNTTGLAGNIDLKKQKVAQTLLSKAEQKKQGSTDGRIIRHQRPRKDKFSSQWAAHLAG